MTNAQQRLFMIDVLEYINTKNKSEHHLRRKQQQQ